MKSSTGPRTVRVSKAAVLKKPRKYKKVGGAGSSPRSGSSPIISISKEDKNELKDISFDIVKLIKIYKSLSEVSVNEYSFSVLDTTKTDFLVFTRVTTKIIKEMIDNIFVKVKNSQFISIDTSSYEIFSSKYDVQINDIIDRITQMTTKDFIVETKYTIFFADLRFALLTFFDYIQTYITINDGISDEGIIDIVDNEILRCAKGGYAWFSDKENKRIGANNIKQFMDIRGNTIKEQERERDNEEFRKMIERERKMRDIEDFYNIGKNRRKGW